MSEPTESRAANLAGEYEAAAEKFVRLVDSLSDEQWRRVGRNGPERINDEDEGRTVGVIAHHVALSGSLIMGRIQATLEGRPLPQVDIRAMNATHAAEQSDVTREEVAVLLRRAGAEIAAAVRAIPDEKLDTALETPFGRMSVKERLERVLIGHVKGHQASIEVAVS